MRTTRGLPLAFFPCADYLAAAAGTILKRGYFHIADNKRCGYYQVMERVVHKSLSFKDAAEWDVRQQLAMTPQERIRAARALRKRAYPGRIVDVRAWHGKT